MMWACDLGFGGGGMGVGYALEVILHRFGVLSRDRATRRGSGRGVLGA
jgi:hypothetical protein